LKFSKENGYEIFVLGKNGEPKEGLQMNLNFNSKNIDNELTTSLETDKEGKISLGQL